MLNPLILTATLIMIAGTAVAHDAAGRPETGRFAPHVTGATGDGQPEVHRPAASTYDGVSGGVATISGGAEDRSIIYTGQARGSLGFPASRVVGNEGGQPIVEHGHQQPSSR